LECSDKTLYTGCTNTKSKAEFNVSVYGRKSAFPLKNAKPHTLFTSNHPEAHAWGITCNAIIAFSSLKVKRNFIMTKLI